MQGTNKHMEIWLIHFKTHKSLFQSEENKCMWTHCESGAIFTVCSHIFIYSLLIEKDLCECQNISVKFQCVYLCLLIGDLFICLVRVSSFYFYLCVIRILVLSLVRWSLIMFTSNQNAFCVIADCQTGEKYNRDVLQLGETLRKISARNQSGKTVIWPSLWWRDIYWC
jgi:hypothetical protein